MSLLWVLPILGLITILAVACSQDEDVPFNPAGSTSPASTVKPISSPSATPTVTLSPSATSTATLTYVDPTYGYSFDYPASWYLSPPKDNGGSNVILYSYDPAAYIGDPKPVTIDKLKAFLWVAEDVNKPLLDWIADGDNGPGQVSPPRVISQLEITLGEREGVTRVTESDGEQTVSYYIPIGDARVFAVNAGPAESELRPKLEGLLVSLRFAS